MCGFLGEFSFTNTTTASQEFKNLLALSKHRGPDSTEILQRENFQLGFNRLAILDVSKNGNQPKESPSGRYVMVFNGEVYNYKALQEEYKLQNLQSTSDTEVIIHLLDSIGIEQTIEKLNGMFAIAIIDTQENILYLTRDFAGIKPLFYGKTTKGIVFASQFDQLFKHPWHKEELVLRPEIIKEYFGFGYMQAPNTVYEHIYQVNPGELITISETGEFKTQVVHQFSKEVCEVKKKETVAKKYLSVLRKSVKDQLVSDVPIATFLSGGVDSPLITAVAKEAKQNIEAFTFGIDNPKYDESKKASAYANHIDVNQTLETVLETDLLNKIEEHFKYYPEPFGDYSSIPTYVLTQKAKKSHTVMLSGDGGDELFFGYPRMLDVLNKKNWFLIPFLIRKPIIKILNKLNIINTWAPYYYKTLGDWILAKQLHIFPNKLDTFFKSTSFSKEMNSLFELPPKTTKKRMLHWLRYNEFYGHMQRVLIKVDRASMGNSLEVRVPFLGKQSIDFAWNQVPVQLENHSQLKQVLKQSLTEFFPEELINQKKMGFSVPIENWLKNELKAEVEEYIFNKPFYGEELMDVEAIKAYVKQFYLGKSNNGWGVWYIYAWQKWASYHVINNYK